ncbi:hypothetical protein BOTBODRAFT_622286 [Botryobasidium botryosum FD-172 SS1]|uniref:Uncharacterized protein n=1 Tax=Botryobasidium botryosum (strain FD-172 SS1) TaxID=930990 RepID=A0A067MXC0_BOTB1|nr:hypothetical protein BOTBODRAFT_622286 [Botryobasidium botryosum FD-172 SS1]
MNGERPKRGFFPVKTSFSALAFNVSSRGLRWPGMDGCHSIIYKKGGKGVLKRHQVKQVAKRVSKQYPGCTGSTAATEKTSDRSVEVALEVELRDSLELEVKPRGKREEEQGRRKLPKLGWGRRRRVEIVRACNGQAEVIGMRRGGTQSSNPYHIHTFWRFATQPSLALRSLLLARPLSGSQVASKQKRRGYHTTSHRGDTERLRSLKRQATPAGTQGISGRGCLGDDVAPRSILVLVDVCDLERDSAREKGGFDEVTIQVSIGGHERTDDHPHN